MMSDKPLEIRSSSGQEAQDTVRAVLEEQAERRQQRADASPRPDQPSRARAAVTVVLAVVSVALWVSPPEVLQPRPIPPPPPIVQESGLRMDVYTVAVQILRFQSRTGALPAEVEEAVVDPIQADRLEYLSRGRGVFQLTAARDGQVVVYSSDQSLAEFARNAQMVLEEGKP